MVAYGYIWTCVDAYGRLYSRDLSSFLISLYSVRFCDFKFNMATSEGVSTRGAVCVLSLFGIPLHVARRSRCQSNSGVFLT